MMEFFIENLVMRSDLSTRPAKEKPGLPPKNPPVAATPNGALARMGSGPAGASRV